MVRSMRPAGAGIGLVCVMFAGCLQLPYCIPELNYAPAVSTQCKGIHAFRVDITQKAEVKALETPPRAKVVEQEELTEIRTTTQGTTSPQMGVNLATGWRYVGFWNQEISKTGHAIALRFYRPGFETIMLQPGETPTELKWREANELTEQVKAVDELFSRAVAKTAHASAEHVLHPGSKSTAHRDALLFGAGEYERLAKAAADDEPELQDKLLDKAKKLRTLAKASR